MRHSGAGDTFHFGVLGSSVHTIIKNILAEALQALYLNKSTLEYLVIFLLFIFSCAQGKVVKPGSYIFRFDLRANETIKPMSYLEQWRHCC